MASIQKPNHPKDWNSSVYFPSANNENIHKAQRVFFNSPEEMLSQVSKNPDEKNLIKKRSGLYLQTRDPRFFQPDVEAGWDSRAGVRAAIQAKNVHTYRQYYDGGLEGSRPVVGMADPAPFEGEIQRRNVEHFQDQYLKKHSRLPITPLLAQIQSYDNSPATMNRTGIPRLGNVLNPTNLAQTAQKDSFWRTSDLDGSLSARVYNSNRRRRMAGSQTARSPRSANSERGRNQNNQSRQGARAISQALGRVSVAQSDWDSRFHVMVSKDNSKSHNAFREYFDTPRRLEQNPVMEGITGPTY